MSQRMNDRLFQHRARTIGIALLLLAYPTRAQLAAPNDAGVTFAHVHLNVTDLELHKALWTGLFGGIPAEKGGFTAVRVPGVLVFLRERAPAAPSQGTALDHFGFKVRDLDAVLRRWRARGYEVDEVFSDGAGASRAFITMPDGVRLEVEEDAELSVEAEMGHVHFFTPRYRELQAWYAGAFGAAPGAGSTGEATAHIPGSGLSFGATEAEQRPTEGTALDHIGFEVEDLRAFVERLREEGVKIEVEPRYIERVDLWIAFFVDAGGVLVELTEGLDGY